MSKQQCIIILVALLVLISAFFIEPNSIAVTKYEVKCPELSGVKIVFFSDLHVRRGDYSKLDKLVKLTNKQQPDIVLIGGDYASGNSKNMMNIDTVAQKLSLINAPIYSVLGDSDWTYDGKKVAVALQQNGIKVLENSAKRTVAKRRYLDIVGLADLNKRTIKISKAVRGTSKPRILLTHNPDVYYNVMDEFDLILAGHTHGGQFLIPFTPPLFLSSKYKFDKGYFKPNTNPMIITRGIGMTGLPVRLNCKPEIMVINFVRKYSDKSSKK